MVKVLKIGTKVSVKVDGRYATGLVVGRDIGRTPDYHRYDVRMGEGMYRAGKVCHALVAYQTTPSAANWEEVERCEL